MALERTSTSDALTLALDIIFEVTQEGGTAIAVGLDIANAFNSIPLPSIRKALVKKDCPAYLRRVIDNYLSNRWIEYPVHDGRVKRQAVTAGVPQGSVLGPLLWNLAYDYVLESRIEEGCHVLCYADDTL